MDYLRWPRLWWSAFYWWRWRRRHGRVDLKRWQEQRNDYGYPEVWRVKSGLYTGSDRQSVTVDGSTGSAPAGGSTTCTYLNSTHATPTRSVVSTAASRNTTRASIGLCIGGSFIPQARARLGGCLWPVTSAGRNGS